MRIKKILLRIEKLDQLEDYARELKAMTHLALQTKPKLLEKLRAIA